MITPNVRAMAEKRGMTTAYQLQLALKAPPSMAAKLWKGEFTRIDLATIDRLCELLKCRPNDLLKYEPGGGP